MKRNASKMMCIFAAVVLIAACLTGCIGGNPSPNKRVSQALGIPCDAATVLSEYDSHGGFHGDGTCFYALKFDEASAAEQIAASGDWRPLPLTDNLAALVWGKEIGDVTYQAAVIRDNDWNHPLIPSVEHGYYFFLDRHSQSTDVKNDTHLLERTSLNFTVAVYDTDTDTLYYSEVDT